MVHPLRFGIWASVHGPRAAHQDPEEPYDASWERNRALVLKAEELGYDATLVAQHTINPHQEDLDQLEAWSAAAALAALTSRIEIITAIKPYLFHPVVLAKMALGIENISRGRFAINLVNAWNRPELARASSGLFQALTRLIANRPLLMFSMPSAILASTTGWKRYGLMAVMISMRLVSAASAAAALQASS